LFSLAIWEGLWR